MAGTDGLPPSRFETGDHQSHYLAITLRKVEGRRKVHPLGY